MTRTSPKVKYIYQNHHLDSTNWEKFDPRDSDVILSTSIKSGTTWMQYILLNLIFKNHKEKPKTVDVSPWLDERTTDPEKMIETLNLQTHRRFIKTHLPLDGLPYYPNVKYIVVARDARDVFMSLWNHYRNLKPQVYKALNEDIPGRAGPPFPFCPDDIKVFWRNWITQGWFEWESEGYPFWSNMRHTQSSWNFRHLPNILFVHYSNLLRDPSGQIKRTSDYLDIELSRQELASIVMETSFQNMKSISNTFLENDGSSFKGGGDTFIFKGTNGRWNEVLNAEDLRQYRCAISRTLSPDCATWLENQER